MTNTQTPFQLTRWDFRIDTEHLRRVLTAKEHKHLDEQILKRENEEKMILSIPDWATPSTHPHAFKKRFI